MNADAYFGIGYSHKVCEDYALADVHEDIAYAILSDGCSSSLHTDIGARLLTHIAKDAILYMHRRKLLYDYVFLHSTFKSMFEEMIIKKALEVKDTLHLNYEIFDATLLVAVCIGTNHYLLYGRGDGYFIVKDKEGITTLDNVHFNSNAPYYLSYDMSFDKETAYRDLYGKDTAVIYKGATDKNGELISKIDSEVPSMETSIFMCEALLPSISQIILTSDGVESFEDTNPELDLTQRKIDPYAAINKFIDYKNPVGEFVQRRMTRLRKEFIKDGFIHQDDISCAAINM